ncbi:hypothetical protein, partial [Burkholderia ambifaria]|uniref:hypothetical protein n=1 Tax=Burkholderia ambifaria TaxID=152480 RepID=UPI001ABAD634
AEIVREWFAGRDHWDVKIFDRTLKHGAKLYTAPPAQVATRQGLTDEQWYDLASRHANAEWNGDGYLASVKALCDDYRALLAAQQPAPIAHFTDDHRDKIERAEACLRNTGRKEDRDAANGLLDVLIAYPVLPTPCAEVTDVDKDCAGESHE